MLNVYILPRLCNVGLCQVQKGYCKIKKKNTEDVYKLSEHAIIQALKLKQRGWYDIMQLVSNIQKMLG